MGNSCCNQQSQNQQQIIQQSPNRNLQTVDTVKLKLKQARDRIRMFIAKKNVDIEHIDQQIRDKLPRYQQTKNRKELIPLLKAKKDLQQMINKAEVRLRLLNDKLNEVQLQQLNQQTISVLDDSNRYIKQIQEQLQKKDWRNVLDEAQKNYSIEWPSDSAEVESDPAFQKMWAQLGGKEVQRAGTCVQLVGSKQKLLING